MTQLTKGPRGFERSDAGRLITRGLAICLLAVWLPLVVPGTTQLAYAAPLEDCDLDGFDDATGAPVPWPGYDETRGDTPAGPGTADWWTKQNQQAKDSRSTSTSGGNGSSPASGKSGSGASTPRSGSTVKKPVSSSTGSGSRGSTGSTSGRSGRACPACYAPPTPRSISRRP